MDWYPQQLFTAEQAAAVASLLLKEDASVFPRPCLTTDQAAAGVFLAPSLMCFCETACLFEKGQFL